MAASDALDFLRAHDPARTLAPVDQHRREGLRTAIVSTPLTVRPSSARFRPLIVAGAAALALVFAAVAWAVYAGVFQSASQVRNDFATESAHIPLPPGASWQPLSLDEQALYAGPAAKMYALAQATCSWFAYWDAGHRNADPTQTGAAQAGFARVRAMMPVHQPGSSEDTGGYDAGSLAFLDRVARDQRSGLARSTEQYLAANCR
jgi:hypothetical protein